MATGENVLWVVSVYSRYRYESTDKEVLTVFRTRVAALRYKKKLQAKPYKGWHRRINLYRATWGPNE